MMTKILKCFGLKKTPRILPKKDDSEYRALFDRSDIRAEWVYRVDKATDLVLKGAPIYEAIQDASGLPWHLVGIVHYLESNCNFKTHLHNGDSLLNRTFRVPKGRPVNGEPPFTWEYSALDALKGRVLKGPRLGDLLEFLERYNGMGYRKKGINTPYLWSGTTAYYSGKYIRDGIFDHTAISKQVGGAAIYKNLILRGTIDLYGIS
jgi:lysozyme family protein